MKTLNIFYSLIFSIWGIFLHISEELEQMWKETIYKTPRQLREEAVQDMLNGIPLPTPKSNGPNPEVEIIQPTYYKYMKLLWFPILAPVMYLVFTIESALLLSPIGIISILVLIISIMTIVGAFNILANETIISRHLRIIVSSEYKALENDEKIALLSRYKWPRNFISIFGSMFFSRKYIEGYYNRYK
jgi:hypothetical protein